MNRIKQEEDVIVMRVGGPDEWAASNAIRAAYIKKWQAEEDAARAESERAQTDTPSQTPDAPQPALAP